MGEVTLAEWNSLAKNANRLQNELDEANERCTKLQHDGTSLQFLLDCARQECDAAIARADNLEQRLWRALSLLRKAGEFIEENIGHIKNIYPERDDILARITAATQAETGGEDDSTEA